MQRRVGRAISEAWGQTVGIERVGLSLWPPGLTLHNARVEAERGERVLTAPRVRVGLGLAPLLRRTLSLSSVVLVEPTLSLARAPDGSIPAAQALTALVAPSRGEEPAPTSEANGFQVPVSLHRGRVELPGAGPATWVIRLEKVTGVVGSRGGDAPLRFQFTADVNPGGTIAVDGSYSGANRAPRVALTLRAKDVRGDRLFETPVRGFDVYTLEATLRGRPDDAFLDTLEGEGHLRMRGADATGLADSIWGAVIALVPGVKANAEAAGTAENELESFRAGLRLRDRSMAIDDLEMVTSAYQVTGSGSLSLALILDLDIDVAMTPKGIQDPVFASERSLVEDADFALPNIPLRVTGPVSSPRVTSRFRRVPVSAGAKLLAFPDRLRSLIERPTDGEANVELPAVGTAAPAGK